MDQVIERRLADPGLGEEGVEGQAAFRGEFPEPARIDPHSTMVLKNRTGRKREIGSACKALWSRSGRLLPSMIRRASVANPLTFAFSNLY